MSEAKPMGLPGTEESTNQKYMQAGLHLVKVINMVEGVDKNGKKILDKNNNPCVRVTFQNKDGEQAEGLYFYSELPLDDPGRKDDSKRCKSEFRLHNLKTALGFGVKSAPDDKVKAAKIWLVVTLQDYFDVAGNPVINDNGKQKSWHSVGEAFPFKKDEPGQGRPMLKGDPATDKENFLTGVFYEKIVDKTRSVRPEEHLEEEHEASTPGETPVSPGDVAATPEGGASDW